MGDDLRISHQEWVWVAAWSAVILLVTSLPYLYGAWLSTPQNQFGGFVLGVEDGNSYLAKMRLGATGSWQFHLFYTSEPHPGAYLFLFHLLLGKLARLSGLPLILVYHLARLGCGALLLATVYCFAAFFTRLRPVRRLTFWLVALGSGLGWLVLLSGFLPQLGLPLDFYSPEAFAFLMLFSLPHLSLALACVGRACSVRLWPALAGTRRANAWRYREAGLSARRVGAHGCSLVCHQSAGKPRCDSHQLGELGQLGNRAWLGRGRCLVAAHSIQPDTNLCRLGHCGGLV